ncbi:hypothetical protein EVAR_39609_1 [Eumeta japonica]|uniref:Mariner Mos1 transposase n=1 Tax=Eumeta variegata TaxID=151549 RepID=A0A4C1WG25_EUMVA|nr:hypothetical protein EVAR_39609_1 [Eumeta japonica]
MIGYTVFELLPKNCASQQKDGLVTDARTRADSAIREVAKFERGPRALGVPCEQRKSHARLGIRTVTANGVTPRCDVTPPFGCQRLFCVCTTRLIRFKRVGTNLTDDLREGRPSTATTRDNITVLRLTIESDKRVTYQQIQISLGIDMSQVHKILHEPTEILAHPLRSLDLALCDFYLFPKMKGNLREKWFTYAEEAVGPYENVVQATSKCEDYRTGNCCLAIKLPLPQLLQWIEKNPPADFQSVPTFSRERHTKLVYMQRWIYARGSRG